MGEIIARSVLAKASRARLHERASKIGRAAEDGDAQAVAAGCLELGRLIHEESLKAYVRCDVPAQLANAPWIYLLGQMQQDGLALDVKAALSCVEEFLGAVATN